MSEVHYFKCDNCGMKAMANEDKIGKYFLHFITNSKIIKFPKELIGDTQITKHLCPECAEKFANAIIKLFREGIK